MTNDDRRSRQSSRARDDEADVDRQSFERGNRYDQAREYGRAHDHEYRRSGFAGDYDRSDDYGRGAEHARDERHGSRRSEGVHATEQGEPLRSRSADPGQSSYGGFANEDPRYQRQQIEHYEGGRGFGGSHQGSQGGQQPGRRSEGHQHAYGRQRIQPKGYTRSDERIREDVCERLSHSGLDVSEVSVNVAEGNVTLEGTVKHRRVKHSIEDCAEACLGVIDVVNHITVQRDEADGHVR